MLRSDKPVHTSKVTLPRVGACADVLGRLAAAKINVTAMDAVASSAGRYTAILWVKARDVKKAVAVLGAV